MCFDPNTAKEKEVTFFKEFTSKYDVPSRRVCVITFSFVEPGVGQTIALHALPTAGISSLPVHSTSFLTAFVQHKVTCTGSDLKYHVRFDKLRFVLI